MLEMRRGIRTCNNCHVKTVNGKYCKGSKDITEVCSKYNTGATFTSRMKRKYRKGVNFFAVHNISEVYVRA